MFRRTRERITELEADRDAAVAKLDAAEGRLAALAAWPVRKKVLVSLKSGRAIRGILHELDEELMHVRNAELVESDAARSLDGPVTIIERVDVDFVQVLSR
ncbi:MAG: hypothetical protein WD739_07325 [Actinomycetota bacterium]